MKRVPMLLLLVMPYGLIACIRQRSSSVAVIGLALFTAVLLFNMIYAFFLPRLGFTGKQILFWNMLLKLCNIPIFLLVFTAVLLANIAILPALPLLFLFDYLLLLSSTMFGISGILYCYRHREISLTIAIIHMIAQFLFCFDVLSACCCYLRVRKQV